MWLSNSPAVIVCMYEELWDTVDQDVLATADVTGLGETLVLGSIDLVSMTGTVPSTVLREVHLLYDTRDPDLAPKKLDILALRMYQRWRVDLGPGEEMMQSLRKMARRSEVHF